MRIVVYPAEVTHSGTRWKISSRCEGDCPSTLWYSGDGPAPDPALSGAAMLLPALLRAMHVGADLDFRPLICDMLAMKTESAIVPLLSRFAPDLLPNEPAVLFAKSSTLQAQNIHGAATGMSCGLDSLAATRELIDLPAAHTFSLSALTHFDTGNHDALHVGSNQMLYESRIKRAQACAATLGVPLISITSNVDEWAPGDFARLHTVRNISAAHLVSGRVRHYFYANGVRIEQTMFCAKDTAYIDAMLIPLLSTSALSIHQSTPALGAPEKAELIAEWDVAQRFLNVCFFEDMNCGKCEKCLRRMLVLDAIGAYKNFATLFPAHALEAQRSWYLGYLLAAAHKSRVHKETVDFLCKRRYKHLRPFNNYLAWLVRRAQNLLLRVVGRPRRPL